MAEPRSAASDPSMDDILASIRKIISEDEARAQAGRPAVAQPAAAAAPREDVLLLTNPIEEPQASKAAGPPPVASPRFDQPRLDQPRRDPPRLDRPRLDRQSIDPARAAEMPQPSVEQLAELVSGQAAENAVSALTRLNRAVQEAVPAPQAEDPGPAVGGGSKTLEDLVKEALRPMLQEWLDRNLPQIVERHVEREIVRLTRR